METSRAIPFNDLHHQIPHTRHTHPRDLRTKDLYARDEVVATTCTNPNQRREWRSLSTAEQEEYISAVKCLATKPSRLNLTTTLYDDFPYVHNELNSKIHFVASFLPWHRWFVHIYEQALQGDCGLSFPMPYWDWSLDAGHLPDSALLSGSARTGFGGTGPGGFVSPSRPNPLTSCVPDGAFANLTVAYYSGAARPHCLNRGFADGVGDPVHPERGANMSAYYYTPTFLEDMADSNTEFAPFWRALEDGPHGAIHNAIGGDMIPGTSPNDPLFFMHHAQVDRLWWLWQQGNPAVRDVDFGGNRDPVTDPAAADTAEQATLADSLVFLGLGNDVTVGDIMTTKNNLLCYAYE
ncbi:monooxygenase [Diaporthe sp. PMI_573]|nr:monooxygenase [Diaporthaceae sp. PMI_573]